MKGLRITRISLQIIFIASTAAYFILCGTNQLCNLSHKIQIITLMMAETAGVAVIWGIITFVWGRIYCSSVCPVGTFLDFANTLRKRIRPRFTFKYSRTPKYRYVALAVYILLLISGIHGVAFLLDPWLITSNIAGVFGSPEAEELWMNYAVGSIFGCAIGIISLIVISLTGFLLGRNYCNSICPIGLALSFIGSKSIFNIVIDPDKCSGCLKCEEICKSSCIKAVSRYIDNSRCVRCFNCISECPDKAIRFRPGMPKAATPLMRRTSHTKA